MSSIPPASSIFAMYASMSAFMMLVKTVLNQVVPRCVQQHVVNVVRRYFAGRGNNATIVIEEREGMSSNEVYSAAEVYLCTKVRPNMERLKISKLHRESGLCIGFAQCESILDFHHGIHLKWRFINEKRKKKLPSDDDDGESERRYFELVFDRRHKERVLDSYVPFLLERAAAITAQKKVVRLHTLTYAASYMSSFVWDSINLDHPSTFHTLAMEPALKNSILEDLDRFVRRKDFYRKVGRAWKRGYLLYGPPGTGKSSLIAAMANHLKFDLYDLDLTNVRSDSDLRRIILRTDNRSILVIEDIDCTVQLPHRNALTNDKKTFPRPRDHQFTLSGLLNFMDGLWSSCGDERIIIFTTNNKEKLDPALLRPGRMDMHIHMSYLTPAGFSLLASTYLDIHDKHPRLPEIQDLIRITNVTPAEVAEELMKSDDADACLDGVLNFIRNKIATSETDRQVVGDDSELPK